MAVQVKDIADDYLRGFYTGRVSEKAEWVRAIEMFKQELKEGPNWDDFTDRDGGQFLYKEKTVMELIDKYTEALAK